MIRYYAPGIIEPCHTSGDMSLSSQTAGVNGRAVHVVLTVDTVTLRQVILRLSEYSIRIIIPIPHNRIHSLTNRHYSVYEKLQFKWFYTKSNQTGHFSIVYFFPVQRDQKDALFYMSLL